MSQSGSDILEATSPLADLFPEAKLTMRDRLPINFILTNALITIQKSILNIKYSGEEIREAVQGFVAMIPDSLKDDQFNEDIQKATQTIPVDVRPEFCEVKASLEYCEKHGLQVTQMIQTFDYFAVLHACFNLLMRKDMLLKKQPKEIFTGKRARGEEPFEPETEEL